MLEKRLSVEIRAIKTVLREITIRNKIRNIHYGNLISKRYFQRNLGEPFF
jgi:hypothetical protein